MHNYGLHLLKTRLADIELEQAAIESKVASGHLTGTNNLYTSDEYLKFSCNVRRIDELQTAIIILSNGLEGQNLEI